MSSHIFRKKLLQLIERDGVLPAAVIQICVDCIRDDQQLLVICIRVILHHCGISIAAEIAGMCFLPVHDKDCAADLIAVLKDGLVYKGHTADHIPAIVGI